MTFPRVRIGALAAILVVLTACGGGPTVPTVSAPSTVRVTTTPPPVAGSGSCTNPSRTHDGRHGIQVEGTTANHAPLTVLFAGVHGTIPAGKELRTFVRVGGARALRISVIGTNDRVDRASGFRPGLPRFDWPGAGTPWTGTLRFADAGCWRVYVERGGLTGELWLRAG